MTILFNRVPPAGDDPRAIATELNRIIEYLETTPARILGLTQIIAGLSLPAGTWTQVPLTNLITAFPAQNMRLGTGAEVGRLIYDGTRDNALSFHASLVLSWTGATSMQTSFRKNGDNGTVEPIFATTSGESFEIGLVGAFDMAPTDYVELVVNPGAAVTATGSLSFFAESTSLSF